MADITQTAANVAAVSGAPTKDVVWGETIVAGDVVYEDATDGNKYKKAINSAEAAAAAKGVALNGGASGQPGRIQTGGGINPGGTVVVGEVYNVSPQAGKFAPDADVLTADFRTVLGIGTTTSNIKIGINVSAIAVA